MEFDWSEDDIQHRRDIRAFLQQELPDDWEEMSSTAPVATPRRSSAVISAAAWRNRAG
ncbi:MAG: hypothetical protein R3E50_06575 [Halioglobus sp.]